MLSTISGTPCACAIAAMALPMSVMLPRGLPIDSTNTAFVRSSISWLERRRVAVMAKRAWMPNCGSVLREQVVGAAVERAD